MARITVEDCIEVVKNRFELVVIAAHRAKQISSGVPILVNRDNDKNPVVALREIADKLIDVAKIKENVINKFQHGYNPSIQTSDDIIDDDSADLENIAALKDLDVEDEMRQIVDESDLGDDFSFDGDNVEVED